MSYFFPLPPSRDDGVSPSVDALLSDSETLLLVGYVRASAVIARAALERALGEACRAANVWPENEDGRESKTRSLDGLSDALRKAAFIDKSERKTIGRLIHVGHDAAHGQGITRDLAFSLIAVTHRIRRMTLPPSNDAVAPMS